MIFLGNIRHDTGGPLGRLLEDNYSTAVLPWKRIINQLNPLNQEYHLFGLVATKS